MVTTAIAVLAGLQTLVTFTVDGEGPVRVGLPLPADLLSRGLALEGEPGAVLQWAPLQEQPGVDGDRLWVELCVLGARGTVRLVAGGAGPSAEEGGPACAVVVERTADDVTINERAVRTWADGTVDERVRTRWLVNGESAECAVGEAATSVGPAWLERRMRVEVPARFWRRAGVLPRARAPGEGPLRQELLGLVPRLPVAPGGRGRGDYVRGAGVITNLEFDTTLGFVRLGLATGSRTALERAWASARHLVDRDLDLRSGLPCRHGRDHRSARPELGHVWIRGLILTACVFAERDLLDVARSIARSLADRVRAAPRREGVADRLRDEAWPLWELEEYLRFEDVEPVRVAADAVAARMLARFDSQLGVLRYGETETRGASVKDRLWLSVGIASPALRRYARRTGDVRAEEVARALELRAAELLRSGRPGLPIQCMVSDRGTFGELRVRDRAEGFLLLDGLSHREQRRLLGRVRDELGDALDASSDDLVTRWSIAARCEWVLR